MGDDELPRPFLAQWRITAHGAPVWDVVRCLRRSKATYGLTRVPRRPPRGQHLVRLFFGARPLDDGPGAARAEGAEGCAREPHVAPGEDDGCAHREVERRRFGRSDRAKRLPSIQPRAFAIQANDAVARDAIPPPVPRSKTTSPRLADAYDAALVAPLFGPQATERGIADGAKVACQRHETADDQVHGIEHGTLVRPPIFREPSQVIISKFARSAFHINASETRARARER